jgi:hypothetical protein
MDFANKIQRYDWLPALSYPKLSHALTLCELSHVLTLCEYVFGYSHADTLKTRHV